MEKIKEGKVTIDVPKGKTYDRDIFYNPDAKLTRDIGVSALSVFAKENGTLKVCEALGASGIRGIRYAKEVKGVKVTINDVSPSAVKLIKKNVKANKAKATVTNKEASLLLYDNIYDFIDIDPFGAPTKFLMSAARSIYRTGMLAVTATDQSALIGKYPEACFRKYGLKSLRTDFYNELAVRIVITSIIREMAKYDKMFIPQLSFAHMHYFRTIGRIEGFKEKHADLLGYVNYCKCGERYFGDVKENCVCGKKFEHCGPVYLGPIQDKNFVEAVVKDLKARKFNEALKLVEKIKDESDLPEFYYDIHKITSGEMVKLQKIIDSLHLSGFKAGRTHFCDTGIKTNASLEDLKKST